MSTLARASTQILVKTEDEDGLRFQFTVNYKTAKSLDSVGGSRNTLETVHCCDCQSTVLQRIYVFSLTECFCTQLGIYHASIICVVIHVLSQALLKFK